MTELEYLKVMKDIKDWSDDLKMSEADRIAKEIIKEWGAPWPEETGDLKTMTRMIRRR